jgi:hypothetical protein
MKAAARMVVVAVSLLSFTACTTLQSIEDFSPSVLEQRIEPGDRVHVVTRNGTAYDLTVSRVDSTALWGEANSGKRYKIPFEAILDVKVAETDVVASAAGALVTVYTVAALIVTYAIIAWSSEND